MDAIIKLQYGELTFTDADVVNPLDWIPAGESNPYNVRPWLFHDHGFAVGVVFADCLQDALDELADSGKIDHLGVSQEELADYGATEEEQEERLTRLGDASEPFDIESLAIIEIQNPKASWCAQFMADEGDAVRCDCRTRFGR
jgi:hypothetical protein